MMNLRKCFDLFGFVIVSLMMLSELTAWKDRWVKHR